jgi:3-deoxy-manno-octulosonate cytidylyltransferase (CMP-KDO synthetase)
VKVFVLAREKRKAGLRRCGDEAGLRYSIWRIISMHKENFMVKIFGAIPARFASQRFPGKPMALIAGVPMVVRVYRRALASGIFDALFAATDDERILALCREYDVPALMTRGDHKSGSDRVYEAACIAGQGADIIVNVQGDEPFLDPEALIRLVQPLRSFGGGEAAASVYARITEPADYGNPNVVKVVLDGGGRALYFSRANIPFSRDGGLPGHVGRHAWRHVGLYAYTLAALERFVRLPPGRLEEIECLEQLRLLENGIPIFMEEVAAPAPAVDTPADLAALEAMLANGELQVSDARPD